MLKSIFKFAKKLFIGILVFYAILFTFFFIVAAVNPKSDSIRNENNVSKSAKQSFLHKMIFGQQKVELTQQNVEIVADEYFKVIEVSGDEQGYLIEVRLDGSKQLIQGSLSRLIEALYSRLTNMPDSTIIVSSLFYDKQGNEVIVPSVTAIIDAATAINIKYEDLSREQVLKNFKVTYHPGLIDRDKE